MKKLWFPALAVLLLAGCTPDRTLDTLIPRHSLAVVLVDHPSLAVQALGSAGSFPLKALETGKPWAAAVVPANPPGFVLALALADKPASWSDVELWARERGGLVATRLGTYAVLSSPGLPEPTVLDPDARFDLARVRAGGDALALYIDMKNVMDEADLPEALRPMFVALPWAEKNLLGVRLGVAPKDGGLEVRVATDWRSPSEGAALFKGWRVAADPGAWSGLLPATGVGAVFSLPPATWNALVPSADPALSRRWSALAPLVGPRIAAVVSPSDGPWSWTVAVETQDAQAVRQALKTLVAGGDLQRSFPKWALDADTPLIYRDEPGAGGVRASVTLGPAEFLIGYEANRVVFAGGPGSTAALARWKKPGTTAPWMGQAPPGATAIAAGSVDGLGAKAAIRVLGDGNVELRVWVDGPGVKTWQERLPQALLGWLSGEGGWTRWEP